VSVTNERTTIFSLPPTSRLLIN